MRTLTIALVLIGCGVAPGCSCSDNGMGEEDLGDFDLFGVDLAGDFAGQAQDCTNGQPCPGGQQCNNGTCGCPPYQAFCNGQCIPVANDANNCGGCDVKCTGALACSGGKCEAGCLPGPSICSNACVDTQNDSNNCGTCGHKCMPTGGGQPTGCAAGTCVPAAGSSTGPAGMCPNGGPPITVGTPGGGVCSGNLAGNTFTWALCSCSNVSTQSLLDTDAFD